MLIKLWTRFIDWLNRHAEQTGVPYLAFGIFGVGITNISPTSFGTVFIVAAVIFYLLKTLIGIAIKLWGDLFVFENY